MLAYPGIHDVDQSVRNTVAPSPAFAPAAMESILPRIGGGIDDGNPALTRHGKVHQVAVDHEDTQRVYTPRVHANVHAGGVAGRN